MIEMLPPHRGFPVRAKEMLRRREGAIGIVFAVLLIPLILSVGLAVDYGRGYMTARNLQGIVDSAALAGATVFDDPSREQLAIDTAQEYVTKEIATLPSNVRVGAPTITPTISPDCGVANPAYRVTVSVSATIGNTFMSLAAPTFPMTVTATAANPMVQFNIDVTNFSAQGVDGNALYWYQVPDNGVAPWPGILNLIASNTPQLTGNSGNTCVSGSQKIGFAFADLPGANTQYGSKYYDYNTYGGAAGNTYYYYSTLFPPQIQAYPTLMTDNSLQIVALNSDGSYPPPQTSSYTPTASDFQFPTSFQQPIGNPTMPLSTYAPEDCMLSEHYAGGYGCFPANAEPLAPVASSGAVTCKDLGSGGIHVYWNDMGPVNGDPWNTLWSDSTPSSHAFDNLNYTDAGLTFTCPSTAIKEVHLEK